MRIAVFVLALCAAASVAGAADGDISFTAHSAKSGRWSDVATWREGRLPAAGENVQVAAGTTVTYDLGEGPAFRAIHVAGKLTFSREKSTVLSAGLIKVPPGERCSEDGFVCAAHAPAVLPGVEVVKGEGPALEMGTAEAPIPAGIRATVRLVYFEGMDKETLPAVMSCGGRWDVHGAPLSRTWVKLGADVKKGESAVTLG